MANLKKIFTDLSSQAVSMELNIRTTMEEIKIFIKTVNNIRWGLTSHEFNKVRMQYEVIATCMGNKVKDIDERAKKIAVKKVKEQAEKPKPIQRNNDIDIELKDLLKDMGKGMVDRAKSLDI